MKESFKLSVKRTRPNT